MNVLTYFIIIVSFVTKISAKRRYGISAIVLIILLGMVTTFLVQSDTSKPTEKYVGAKQTTDSRQKPLELIDFTSVIASKKASVVKIESEVCGYISTGTGFMVAPDLVLTNAHAVAGNATPRVLDDNGSHVGTTILFDPVKDIAVIRVRGLTGSPLDLEMPKTGIAIQGSHNGERMLLMGYPKDGEVSTMVAGVSGEESAVTYDIYGESMGGQRQIFVLDAVLQQGYSGGPVIRHNGQIAGIIFAIDPGDHKGLAMPTIDFIHEVQSAQSLYTPADVQSCYASALH